jgi:methylglutaconyl-CoA hydratase
MTRYTTITYEVSKQQVATITLNRPEVKHAFNEVMIGELLQCLQEINTNDHIRMVALKSQGSVFCAGADLTWMQKMAAFTEAENKKDATELASLMHTLYTLSKPTVAIVQGHAFGGGVGLVACCDIALASDNARFCFSEVKLGLCPSVISPYAIRAIGLRQAQRYFLTAETFDANTAAKMGLIHECAPDSNILNEKAEMVITQLLKNAPNALKECKILLQKNIPLSTELVEYTIQHIAKLRTSPEGQSGIQSFLNSTTPPWGQS